MSDYGTLGGEPITEEMVAWFAAEAEAGYDPEQLVERSPGRPDPIRVYLGACPSCGSEEPFAVFWQLKAQVRSPLGNEALCHWWPWALCQECGYVAESQVTHEHEDGE